MDCRGRIKMNYEQLLVQQIGKRDKRITELEEYLQKIQADRINDIAKERKRWGKEDLRALAVRDLRQQAKGLTDYAKEQDQGLNAVWMIIAASKLIKQADELEGGE